MKKSDGVKKQTIMEKAEELFAARGFHNTTISQIARACSISESGLYEYFKSKEDLLFCIPEKHFLDLLRSLENHLLGLYGAENKVRKLIWHYLLFMEERPMFARIFILEIWSNQRFYRSHKSMAVFEYWRFVEQILKEALNEGVFRENLDILTSECLVFGTMNHIIMSQVVFNRPLALVKTGEVLEQMLMDALIEKSMVRKSLWGVEGKKEAILEAALEEFDQRGYAQTTISRISNRAGITDPTIYEYFKSKEEILTAIPELAVDRFLNDLKQTIVQSSLPQNHLKLFIWSQVDSYKTYPEYYRVLLKELRCNPKFYKSPAYVFIRKYTEQFTSILLSGMDSGVFRQDLDLGMVRHLYFGLFDQLLLYSMVRPEELQLSEKMEKIYDLMIHAVS